MYHYSGCGAVNFIKSSRQIPYIKNPGCTSQMSLVVTLLEPDPGKMIEATTFFKR